MNTSTRKHWHCLFLGPLSRVLVICGLFLGAGSASGQCVPAPTGVIAWWPGDGNANDATGSHNGTVVGSVPFVPGMVGQAFSLDIGNYVSIPDSPALDPPTNAISVVAWIRPNNAHLGAILTKYNSSTNSKAWVLELLPNGGLRWAIFNDITNEFRAVDTIGGLIVPGVFQHVAGTFDVATQEMRTYVDGVEVANTLVPGLDSTVSSLANTSADVRIGTFICTSGSPCNYFIGLIDEPILFGRVLDLVEIQDIFNAGAACECFADIAPIDVNGNHGNGIVNIDDLVFVLNSFGQSTKPGQPTNIGDINFNGIVNIDDLVDVLNAFGPCP